MKHAIEEMKQKKACECMRFERTCRQERWERVLSLFFWYVRGMRELFLLNT